MSAPAAWWPSGRGINTIAGNLANLSTTHNELGEAKPYQPRFVTFQADSSIGGADGTAGVRVDSVEISNVEPVWKYQPGHPDAIKSGEREGYVAYPGYRHDDWKWSTRSKLPGPMRPTWA